MTTEAYCGYCDCEDCAHGTQYLYHAKTADGRWICDVCYTYDLCTSGPQRNANGPCEDGPCPHRPLLMTEWCK